MIQFASMISSTESLNSTSSPQYQAVEWLVQDEIENGSFWPRNEMIQRYVLAVLFYSTDGSSSWDHDPNFFKPLPVCEWRSSDLSCDTNGSVVSIDLHDDGLRGTIPEELGFLTTLTQLKLWDNRLVGSIPSELGRLTNLEFLELDNNGFTGTIPTELAQLSQLKGLYLFNNFLTGSVPGSLCAAPFDWSGFNRFEADCLEEVTCSCCTRCYDRIGDFP